MEIHYIPVHAFPDLEFVVGACVCTMYASALYAKLFLNIEEIVSFDINNTFDFNPIPHTHTQK